MRTSLNKGEWRVAGFIPGDAVYQKAGINPEVRPGHAWVPATVPGHVQSDLVDAGVIPDPFRDSDSRLCEWTSDREWLYETRFAADPGPARLCFGGVDHDCLVYLNGVLLGEHHGMFGFSFDVELASENVLRVLVLPAPRSQSELGDTSLVTTWKARFPYWWDFSARLVPAGIWQDVWIESRDGLGSVAVTVGPSHVEVQARAEAEVVVLDPEGTVVAAGSPGRLEVADPRLWWPNGFGAQPLYTVRTSYAGEVDERRIGFRSVTFDDFQLRVNERDIPVLGWNWVPVHQLYGRAHEQAYRHFLRLVRDAGATMIRVWGGGLLERELFYDLCDEAGIVVWQDFLQSSSAANCEPATDADYTAHAVEQARLMVRARRHHPSLALWCGGNELATGPQRVPLTDEHANAVALRAVAAQEDPGRPWLVTTPTGTVPFADPATPGLNVHGNYWHLGLTEHQAFYDGLSCRFQGEVGCHGAANVATLRRTLTQPWPRDEHWWHKGSWWQRFEVVEDAFGRIDDLETFVAASQWLQAHGLRAIVDAARRRWPEQTGVLLWQLNEPWPNTACSSVVDVFGHAKAGYWAVKNAFSGTGLGSAPMWFDAVTGEQLADPAESGLRVRVDGDRQEVVFGDGQTPLRPLLEVKAELQASVRGRQVDVTAVGGPLHGVMVHGERDHSGPYVDQGWRWFVPPEQSWTVVVDGPGPLVISALNAAAVRVEVS